jgi:hypothetical protein
VTWLLKLYPPRWRQRYGGELAELVATRPFSIGAAVDLIAGAIDAWLYPQLADPEPSKARGEIPMIARMMPLKCAGGGPDATVSDKRKSAAVMIGGALGLTPLWLWAQWRQDNVYVLALAPMAYFLPYLVSLRYTSLKGRSSRAQTILIGGLGVALAAFFVLVGWIGTKI